MFKGSPRCHEDDPDTLCDLSNSAVLESPDSVVSGLAGVSEADSVSPSDIRGNISCVSFFFLFVHCFFTKLKFNFRSGEQAKGSGEEKDSKRPVQAVQAKQSTSTTD